MTSSDPRSATAPYDALLVVSFGGPEKPDDVVPFLENVTRGRGIPRERLEEVGQHYFQLGGRSPLNDLNRAIALKRAISAQGLRCAQIVTTGYVARYKNMDVWTATCGDDKQWALWGAILAAVGLAQIYWSNSRETYYKRK